MLPQYLILIIDTTEPHSSAPSLELFEFGNRDIRIDNLNHPSILYYTVGHNLAVQAKRFPLTILHLQPLISGLAIHRSGYSQLSSHRYLSTDGTECGSFSKPRRTGASDHVHTRSYREMPVGTCSLKFNNSSRALEGLTSRKPSRDGRILVDLDIAQ